MQSSLSKTEKPPSTPGPHSGRDTDEFFRDRQYGELWVGRRPSIEEISTALQLKTKHLDELPSALGKDSATRVHRGVDPRVDALLGEARSQDEDLARVLSELRLIKDEWELAELQTACDINHPWLQRLRSRLGQCTEVW
jgi:Xaa-Pro aminopeptidase